MLLNMLCKDGVTKDLDRHPGLTRLFADILDFAFEFDNLKVKKKKNFCVAAILKVVIVDPKSYYSKRLFILSTYTATRKNK